ncbi:type II toxin-antitoxin system PemK/MazF family toxin [Cysteiniphilum sp. QT6929]|uniref:type II toxin-antitoxin system PemK/MazF family toxin n=1 Tax=Cysteiniphilum sp. QT6929 TaxID=2975055 RepID=UPI0024B3C441|nr:type II toxin-antitoxin system PemK/MazF family toxin [Cysteiniphilum sp. QT6929]WHN64919.1 type II toxin-antitoxin system PemK/MazF family toxin [Cysteiniphilum sp. QT6929]
MTKQYIPERNDIVWLDFEPTKGKEIGKYRPAFVLSSKEYNSKTATLICCPVSTSIRGGATEVLINNIDNSSVVASSIVQTLSWKERKCRFIAKAEKGVFKDVILRLLPLIGAEEIIDDLLSSR